MIKKGTTLLHTALTLVVLLLAPQASAEVAVVVDFENERVLGPFSIIDDADPIGAMVWTRYSPVNSDRVVLNEQGAVNGDGRPSTRFNTVSGIPMAAWGKKNGNAYDVVVSHVENGAWTTPHVIAAGVTTTIDPEPQITLDRTSGDVHLVYFVNETTPSVYHTQAPADLSSWSTPVEVSQVGEKALRPSSDVRQGVLYVAYESHGFVVGDTPRQIVVATSDGAGGFTHEVVASSHHADPNWPRIHRGKGGLWLDWVDGSTEMGWATWRPATGWGAVEIETFSGTADLEFHVRRRIRNLANE